MEEVEGLLRTRPAMLEIYGALESGFPDWCELGSYSVGQFENGFQVASREILFKDENNYISNSFGSLFQAGQVRMVDGFLIFKSFFCFEMEEEDSFTDYSVELGVFIQRVTKHNAFELKVTLPPHSQKFCLKQFVQPNKSLNVQGIKALFGQGSGRFM